MKSNKKVIIILVVLFLSSILFIYFINKSNKDNINDITSNTNNAQVNQKENIKNMNLTNQKTGERIDVINTSQGEIELKLNGDRTPITVNNFIMLAENGFYNGTKFHRIIKDFMIQGGDPLSKDESKKNYWGTGGPDYRFVDEVFADDDMKEGDIAMANAGPNTNGSQFFIVTAEKTPWLNGKHTIFGKVTKGIDIIKKIENVKTDSSDKPLEDVVVKEIKVVK